MIYYVLTEFLYSYMYCILQLGAVNIIIFLAFLISKLTTECFLFVCAFDEYMPTKRKRIGHYDDQYVKSAYFTHTKDILNYSLKV